jgi:hypothetical protein
VKAKRARANVALAAPALLTLRGLDLCDACGARLDHGAPHKENGNAKKLFGVCVQGPEGDRPGAKHAGVVPEYREKIRGVPASRLQALSQKTPYRSEAG